MKKILLAIVLFSFSCKKEMVQPTLDANRPENTASTFFPHPRHIIFVWFENKSYESIIGSPNAPYINSLIERGTLFTNTHANTHPSYPNYVQFFSGDNNGVNDDNCINTSDKTTPNLYTQIVAARHTFAWYSEELPEQGSTVCSSGSYREKHNPTTLWANVPATANKTLAQLPKDFRKLEHVVCITPNLNNDMHDGSVSQGDTWLKNNFSNLIEWCFTTNSIFFIYFDENDGSGDNRIPVIAVGQPVQEGYKQDQYGDHYNFTRMICAMNNASKTWTSNLAARNSFNGNWK